MNEINLALRRSVERRQMEAMIENAKTEALGGNAVYAVMLMRCLEVQGGKEIIWAMTNARQRREIAACARRWKPVGPFDA